MKTFFRFFISRAFWISIALMILLTGAILYGTFEALEKYTNHGEEFSLPDFSGLTLTEAKDLCREKSLRYEVIDSIFDRRKKRGTVVEQDPPANVKVKENRRVFLILNSSKPEMIKMPMVKNVDFKQAWMDLEAYGLGIDRISYIDDPAQHLVLEQKYNGQVVFQGDKIEKGAKIELVLGSGDVIDTQETRVPLLLGLTAKAAKRKLLKGFLNLGAAQYDRSVESYDDSLKAFIWKHRPNSNRFREVPYGTAIHVWLTLDSTKVEPDSTHVFVPDTVDYENIDDVDMPDSLAVGNR